MDQNFINREKKELAKGPLIVFGLVTGLLMVIFSYVLQVAQISNTSNLKYGVLLIYAIGIIGYCFQFGKINNNKVTFGDIFKAGFQAVALATLVLVSWDLISLFAFPEVKTRALEEAKQQMEQQKIPAATITENLKMASDKYTTMIIMMTVFSNVFYGVILSALGALVTKKNK